LNQESEKTKMVIPTDPDYVNKVHKPMRALLTVKIKGVPFKAAIGTKRAQLLGELQHLAEKSSPPLLLAACVAMLFGWGAGILTAWWWL
jgi:hypothetical protein